MAKNIIMHNPFEDIPDFRDKKDDKKNWEISINGAYVLNISQELINKIDYDDRTFINRQKNYEELKEDLGVEELTESIFYAGLINPIYLQEKENGYYRVLSGYRRSIAIRVGYENYESYDVDGNAIIIPKEIDKSELELISLHENVYREDLKIIELAYKINKDAKELGKTLEELSEDYGMSTRQLKRIKGALSYDDALKNILDDIGIKKAELLNRIIKILKETMSSEDVLKKYKDFSASDLELEIKALNSNTHKSMYVLDRRDKKTVIKINKKLDDVQFLRLQEFLNSL